MSNHKFCAIVDAYSAGNQIAEMFAERGWRCIHVQSMNEIPRLFAASFRPADFLTNIVNDGNADAIVSALRTNSVGCVIAGMEFGVELADLLCEKLRLVGNGTRRSSARRNKFEMGEAVRSQGLRAVRQRKSVELSSILKWIHSELEFPVVVKPLRSCSADSVTLCRSDQDVADALRSLLLRDDASANRNEEALVQEFLKGTEYAVNTVSCQGQVYVTEIWKYTKQALNGGDFVLDSSELMSPIGAIQDQLTQYVTAVLDALEIVIGPAHSEVKMTPEGPTLVEIGARLDGYASTRVSKLRGCHGQIELSVDSLIEPDAFFSRTKGRYRYDKACRYVSLVSGQVGTVRGVNIEEIRAMPSFCDIRLKLAVGGGIVRTRDLLSSPGFVTLIHEDPAVVQRDYLRIRELENSGIFDVVP